MLNDPTGAVTLICIIVAALFVALFVVPVSFHRRERNREIMWLRLNGIPVQATVTKVYAFRRAYEREMVPAKRFYVIARGRDAHLGKPRDYQSDPVREPYRRIIGQPVNVYVDPDNPDRYFVYVDGITPRR